MKEVINFESEIFDLSKINPLVTRYKLFIAYASEPANNYIFSEDVLNNLSSTIMGCPVVAGFMNGKDGSILGGHESDLALNENNQVKPTPTPIPVGFADYTILPWWEEYKGKNYLTTFIYIWDGRFPELKNLSERKIFQSMEVAVENDQQGKYKIVNEAFALGLCLLENVDPAFKNSHIEKFSYNEIQNELNKLKQEFEQFASKYDDLDFSIPSGVKKAAQRGLDLRKEYGRGGTSVGLSTARYLVKNSIASPEKVRHIAKYFPRHEDNYLKGKNNTEEIKISEIAWQLWGGDAGRRWSTKLVEAMNKRDEEKMSYFSNSTFNNETINNSEVINDINLNSENFSEEEKEKEGDNVIVEAVEKFSLTSSQIHEILNNALSEYKYSDNNWRKYWVNCFDDTYAYVEDSEDSKTYRIKYNISENIATIDIDSKEEVIRGGYIPVGGNKEEMSTENMAEDSETKTDDVENPEKNKEEMSSNEYVDNNAMQELNDQSAEDNKELSDEQMKVDDDKDKIIAGMKEEMSVLQDKMSKMESDIAAYMEENTKLKEFKTNIDKQNKEFSVETTLKEVVNILPKEELEACRMSAENFSLENIDVWKNEVKAKAFNFSKGITEKKPYIQVGLPVSDKQKKGSGLWD